MGELGTSEKYESQAQNDLQPAAGGFLPNDSLIGAVPSGNFEVAELVGTGGCSRVYRAKQLDDGRIVALKILHSHLLSHGETVARFEREAESGMSLSHPNICTILGYGRLDTGQPYIVMEYLEGESLSSVLRRKGRLQLEQFLPIFMSCCEGLSAAHAKEVVHRDVKPANIFLVGPEHTTAKLVDFGLAKILTDRQPTLTQTGTALGTVQYMSPEQALAEGVDQRSDIYSLACVMYEALSGRHVFAGETTFELINLHAHSMPRHFSELNPPPKPKIPAALEAIIFKALAKNSAQRYQTAEELRCALEVVHNSLLDQDRTEAHARTAVILATLTIATVLVMAAIMAWWH